MKMRMLIIGMSVVMSSQIAAMHRHAPMSAAYKKIAVVGGIAVAAWWLSDWVAAQKCMLSLKKINHKKKIYNWKPVKYRVDRPIESTRNSPTHTNNGAWHNDQFDYYSFNEGVYVDLKNAYNDGNFNIGAEHNEHEDKRKEEVAAQQEAVRITREHDSDEKIQDFLFHKIQAEKKELETYLDRLAETSRYFWNWYNVRKNYKHICKQYSNKLYGDEKDWTHDVHDTIQKAMQPALHTGLFHLIVGKPMYGEIARLYWDLLQRYTRLEKIEEKLKEKIGGKFEATQQEEKRRKELSDKHERQDKTLKMWLWDNGGEAIWNCLFA
ncbi:MAG: hypothetical protein ACHQVS_02080 [Candidatus Babeliales bacterium]